MKIKMIKTIFLTFVLASILLPLSAQIEGDPDTGSSVPVDGGIVTVTLIAAAYGAKRRQAEKDKEV
jgi:hypothetical protein